MGRKRISGLIKHGDIWHIDKKVNGCRICESIKRKEEGVKERTINYGLQVIRHILYLSASKWMDEYDLTWLVVALRTKYVNKTVVINLKS